MESPKRTFARRMRLSAVFIVAVLCLSFFVPHDTARAQITGSGMPHVLLYVTNSKSSIQSLRAHIDSMDIIAPQTYAGTALGKLLGRPSPEILSLARNAGARVMPLIVNQNFSQKAMHDFLNDDAAQNTLITAMINEAKAQGYIGFQYDFEHMMHTDRDLYTAFVLKSVPRFHEAGLQLSVAVGPQHAADPAKYAVGSWENWVGAFDYNALGAAADFISVMAYDDGQSYGPVASLPWARQVLAYSLSQIPANKISFGIPFYAWVMDNKTGKRVAIRGYPAIEELILSKRYIKKGFSEDLGVSWVEYKRNGRVVTAWYEDQKSFKAKLALVNDNHLAGFSAWALGLEDEKNWEHLLAMRAPQYGLAAKYQTK